jgi:hypothetical protein
MVFSMRYIYCMTINKNSLKAAGFDGGGTFLTKNQGEKNE